MQKINIENWKTRQLSVVEVAHLYGASTATIWRWAAAGRIPQPKKHGVAVTRWSGADIAAAMAQAETITDADRVKASTRGKKRSKAA